MLKAKTPAFRNFIYITGVFLFSRVLVLSMGIMAFSIFPQRGEVFHKRPVREVLNLREVWNKYDSTWYQLLAREGYPHKPFDPDQQSTWGFMPLYPLLIRALSLIAGDNYFWIGVALSNICTFAALLVICKLMKLANHNQWKVLLLLMLAGGTFYLSIVYTEGLFLLLTALVFLNSAKKNYALAMLFAGLAAVTRIFGILLFIIPILEILKIHRLRSVRYVPVLAATLIPLGTWLTYLYFTCGEPFAYFKVQAAWGSKGSYPLHGFRSFFGASAPLGSWVNTFWGCCCAGFLILQRKKMPLSYLIFGFLFILMTTSSNYIYGTTRYTLPLIPLYIAAAESSEKLYGSYLALNIAFLTLNISAFVTGSGTFI